MKIFNRLFKKALCCVISLFFFVAAFCQNPIPAQVSYQVYLEDVPYVHLHSAEKPPIGSLCGIALLFIDTSRTSEEIITTDLDEPIIWLDHVGITTKARFMVNDNNQTISLDLLYSNQACAVNIIKNEKRIATGSVTNDFGLYKIRLIGNEEHASDILILLKKLNNYLLKLHTKKRKSIQVSPFYDSESLNVILGKDYSYDTNFELLRFDRSLRNRISKIAKNSISAMDYDGNNLPIKETIETNARVEHFLDKMPDNENMLQGKISTIFKLTGETNYFFLKNNKEYIIEIGYKYENWNSVNSKLIFNNFSIKNAENGDFVSMEVYDLTQNGVPVIYVDFINGVVMEDKGVWKADQVIYVIQDIFNIVKLPNES